MGVCTLTGKYCRGRDLTCGLFNVSARSNNACYWYREYLKNRTESEREHICKHVPL